MEVISPRERRIVGRLVRLLFLRRRRGRTWPVPDWLPHQRVHFDGNSGARVSARWFPVSIAKGTVVLAHPDRRYGQHWFVHAGWVDFLHDRHYNVLTFDFPDYGESGGGSTYYYEDVIAACHWVRDRAPDKPVHLIGLSIGAFAAANASPHLDFLESLILEAPYPSFNAWYGRGPSRWTMALFDRLFPKTSARIQADQNIARAGARRILIVAARDDHVTPVELSRAIARASPPRRTRYVELEGVDHLDGFAKSETYRTAILETLEEASAAPVKTPETVPLNIGAETYPLRGPSEPARTVRARAIDAGDL